LADVVMPQLGETVTEGTVVRWLKSVGEPVKQDEVLFEVSTDKVDSEVPSPATGYLAEILVPEGQTVDVGARLAVITPEPPAGAAPAQQSPAQQSPAQESPAQQAPAPTEPAQPAPAPPPAAAPPVPRPGPGSREPVAAAAAAEQPPSPNGHLLVSPVVRRLMSEHGIDPSEVQGTGPGGRITRADVLAYVDRHRRSQSAGQPAPAATQLGPEPAGPIAAPSPPGGEEVVPFSNIRRLTAEHMVRSKHTSAHTYTAVEVDFENVERVRKAEKERFLREEGVSLTYLPFVMRAVVEGLRRYPRLNASVGDNALIVHHGLHIGVAVDLDQEGLIVPVVHHADTKRLNALAREVADLASRARSKKLSADDITGGTFTITNPGPFGTLFTVPIINQPQVAILSTDGVKRRPVVVSGPDGEESIAIHSVGIVALSYDHRAVDGAYASAFLGMVRNLLETRDWRTEL
jgi:pyruvate dehydrogenase E2 component (dihydrolipoamide acetyltransferase)